MRPVRAASSGFTLIETALAVVIIGVGVIALWHGFLRVAYLNKAHGTTQVTRVTSSTIIVCGSS